MPPKAKPKFPSLVLEPSMILARMGAMLAPTPPGVEDFWQWSEIFYEN
jgi:hypothetical protein